MLFNSIQFLIFFPAVTLLYFLFPQKQRWFLLLLASCLFYMAFIPQYILIIFTLIIIDYTSGIFIEKSTGVRKRNFLIISILANIGMLSFFKYFNFLGTNFNYLSSLLGNHITIPYLSLILPLGLSFHVFQSLSYTIEVFKGKQKAEKNLGIYALYVLFYPQLVAGPIERPQNLLHQFYKHHSFEEKRVSNGLKLMLWGLFKKIVIADRIALLVNPVYSAPSEYSGLTLLITTYLFAFQIYCDFSGYTDIAIGAAQVMGFKLMDNFNRPYFSKSIAEFWSRWHISLSSWFRDYLYIPLGGSRVSKLFWLRNILIVFLVSGLWHGADWKFVIWGVIHGALLIIGEVSKNLREKVKELLCLPEWFKNALSVFITFNLVSLAWIFFRANSLNDAFLILGRIFNDLIKLNLAGQAAVYIRQHQGDFLIILAVIIFMELIHFLEQHNQMRAIFTNKPLLFRWSMYYLLIFAIIFLGVFENIKFIYFQF